MIDPSALNKLSPATQQLVVQLNELYIEFVGPIGQDLAEDVFAQWVLEGKSGPAAVRRYAQTLSEHMDSVAERLAYLQKAEKLLLQ